MAKKLSCSKCVGCLCLSGWSSRCMSVSRCMSACLCRPIWLAVSVWSPISVWQPVCYWLLVLEGLDIFFMAGCHCSCPMVCLASCLCLSLWLPACMGSYLLLFVYLDICFLLTTFCLRSESLFSVLPFHLFLLISLPASAGCVPFQFLVECYPNAD